MKIFESYKKIAKSMLLEYAWDRKFGEPLPTLDDVMGEQEKHKKGDVWQGHEKGDEPDKPTGAWQAIGPSGDQESFGDDKEAAEKHANPEGDKGDKEEPKGKGLGKGDFERDGGEPEDKPFGGDTGKDADFQGEPPEGAREPDDEPKEKSSMNATDMDDVDDSLRSLKQQGKDDIKPPPELERGIANAIDKIESGTTTDDDLEWAKDAYKQLRIQAGYNQHLEDMEYELGATLRKHDQKGKEESITINGKKYKEVKEHAWDRKFGEPLPTLADVMKVKEEKKVTKKHILREMYERIGGK